MSRKQEKNNSKITELEEKVAELTAGWQRTQADFMNFKKQASEDRVKIIESACSGLAYDLLPVLDHFQLAAKHLPKELESDDWAIGIKHIEKQFETILSENGLEKIDTIGEEFDPTRHEAIEEVESAEKEGTVVEEVLAGYLSNGTVLRPAKVKVSKNPPTN